MKNICYRLLCLLLAIAVLCLGGCSSEGRDKYKLGEAAMSAGRYADAAAYFGSADGYRDSEKQLQTIYFEAVNLYEAGSFDQAAEIFEVLAQYEIEESTLYAGISGAHACMNRLDAVGAYAYLESMDAGNDEVAALYSRLNTICFPDIPLIRPEYVVAELLSGEITAEVSNVSESSYTDEIVYTMTSRYTDLAYEQYRAYCMQAFPDSFADESGNYFSIKINDRTCYICNFHSLYGGLVIKIPRY